MSEKTDNRGGWRPGSGRPATSKLTEAVNLRISPEAKQILAGVSNKSEFVDKLIINSNINK